MDHLKNDLPEGKFARYFSKLAFKLWVLFITGVLIWGAYISQFDLWQARSGVGYFMGILGGSLILMQLIYSVRKRVKLFRKVFSVQLWFKIHMICGVVGPVLILFHSNFCLVSPNSMVALISMLLVSSSGLIGRFLYNRIHFSLYGEKIRLNELHQDFIDLNDEVDQFITNEKQRALKSKYVSSMEQIFSAQQSGAGYITLFKQWKNPRHNVRDIRLFLQQLELDHKPADGTEPDTEFQLAHQRLHDNCNHLLKIASTLPGLQISEKLFSLWHVVHLPIFFLMLITAVYMSGSVVISSGHK